MHKADPIIPGMLQAREKQLVFGWKRLLLTAFVEESVVNYLRTGQ